MLRIVLWSASKSDPLQSFARQKTMTKRFIFLPRRLRRLPVASRRGGCPNIGATGGQALGVAIGALPALVWCRGLRWRERPRLREELDEDVVDERDVPEDRDAERPEALARAADEDPAASSLARS